MKTTCALDSDVRDRLLVAASSICAERGFKGASVRMICERAGANLAMVNYYFGSKDELYIAVIRRASENGFFLDQLLPASDGALPAAERLGHLVEHLMFSLLTDGPESEVAKLVTWEIVQPTHALGVIVETLARPMNEAMIALVKEISPQPLSDHAARLHAFSIMGQMVFYANSRPLNDLMDPSMSYDDASIRELARHVTTFSLRGMGVAPVVEIATSVTAPVARS